MKQDRVVMMTALISLFASGMLAAQSGAFKHHGTEFRYVREGKGIPIVSIGSSVSYPQRWFSDELREQFDWVFVDSRHFMPSYQPGDEELASLTLEAFADDIEALRSHLAIDKWVVLGHSFQAQIALAYAQKYPTRTSRLVLVDGLPYSGPDFSEIAEKFWAEQASESRKERHAANRAAMASQLATAPPNRRFVVNYIADAARFWADPTFDSTPLWEGVKVGPAFGRAFALVPSRRQVRAILEDLDAPTLLIQGELDFAVPHVAWEELIQGLSGISYVLLEGVGHNPMTEAPRRFDRALADWLSN